MANGRDINVRLRVRDDGSVVLQRFGRATERTAARSERSFLRMENASRRSAGAMRDFATSLGLLGGVTGAALGIAAVVLPMAKAASVTNDLQVALAGVQAVSGATADDMARLEKQARDLGSSTQFSAAQAAGAQEFLAKAGFEVNEVLGATPATLDLAAAGMLDLGRAADISSNVLQAFQGEAHELQNIVDIMAATSSNANTSVEQMGKAMEYVAPVANSFGISIEETAAGIAVLSNAGFQAEKAGTGLRRVLVDLANPSGKLQEAMGGLSVEADGLTAVMTKVANSSLTAQDAMDIFGQRGGPAFNILRAGAKDAAAFAEAMGDVDGAARNIAETRLDNLSGHWTKFGSAMAEVGTKIGTSGLIGDLRGLTQALTEMARGDAVGALANNLFPVLKELLTLALSLAAARFGGPALLALGGAAKSAAVGVTTLGGSLATLQSRAALAARTGARLSTLMAGLGGPAGLAILAGIGIARLASRETDLERASAEAAEAQKRLNDEIKETEDASLDTVVAAQEATRTLVETLRNEARRTQRETGLLPPELQQELEEARERLEQLEEQVSETHASLEAFGGAGPAASTFQTTADAALEADTALGRLEDATKRLGERQERAVEDARSFAKAQQEIVRAQFEARAPELEEGERVEQEKEVNEEIKRLRRELFNEERRIATQAAGERLFLLKANIADEEQLQRGRIAIRRDLAEEELNIERRKFDAIQQELIDSLGEEQRLRQQAADAFDIADDLERQARRAGQSQREILQDTAFEAMQSSGREAIELWQEFVRLGGDARRAAREIRQEGEAMEDSADEAGEQTKTLAEELRGAQQAIQDTQESIRKLTENIDMNARVNVDDSEFRAFLDRLARPSEHTVKINTEQSRQLGGPILKAARGMRVPGGYGGGDKVDAKLEPGEWVIRKEAVRRYGSAFMAALNGMKVSPPPIHRQAGGPVGDLMRRTKFPKEGARDQVDINLTAGGERISGAADRELADGLVRVLQGLQGSVPGGVG